MTTSSGGGIKEFRVDRFDEVNLDLTVLGLTLLVSVSTSILFGLAPTLQASRLNLNEALKEEGRGSTDSASRHRIRNFLLVSEVSMAMLLVVWAGLTVQSFRRVLDIDLGFTSSQILTATIDPDVAKRTYDGDRHQLIRQVIDNVQAVPDVESAAVIGELATRRSGAQWVLHIDGHPEVPVSELPTIDGRAISPGYFETLGIPLLSGRIAARDRPAAERCTRVDIGRRDRSQRRSIGRRFRNAERLSRIDHGSRVVHVGQVDRHDLGSGRVRAVVTLNA